MDNNIQRLRQAFNDNPSDLSSRVALASALRRTGDWKQANNVILCPGELELNLVISPTRFLTTSAIEVQSLYECILPYELDFSAIEDLADPTDGIELTLSLPYHEVRELPEIIQLRNALNLAVPMSRLISQAMNLPSRSLYDGIGYKWIVQSTNANRTQYQLLAHYFADNLYVPEDDQ